MLAFVNFLVLQFLFFLFKSKKQNNKLANIFEAGIFNLVQGILTATKPTEV